MLTKKDISDKIARAYDLNKDKSKMVVGEIFDLIIETLVAGEEVNLYGFGKFVVKARGKRKGINPKTKESIMIKATKGVKFRPSTTMKSLVKAGPTK